MTCVESSLSKHHEDKYERHSSRSRDMGQDQPTKSVHHEDTCGGYGVVERLRKGHEDVLRRAKEEGAGVLRERERDIEDALAIIRELKAGTEAGRGGEEGGSGTSAVHCRHISA